METANLSRPFGKSGRSAFALLPQVLLVLGAGPLAERAFGDEDPGTSYFLSPRYSSVSATDRIAAKVDSRLDVFAAEAVGEHLAARLGELAGWLKQSPVNSDRVAALLSDSFAASGWGGREEQVRGDSRLSLFREVAPGMETIDRGAFLLQFRSLAAEHDRIDTAEFKIVLVEANSDQDATRARTAVHFDLVGPAGDSTSHLVQQTGEWGLDWTRSPTGEWLIDRWKAVKRTRAVAAGSLFVDVSEQALGANPSYAGQLRPSVDYWRARLDGALGVDLYGHHGVSAGDIDGDGDDDLYVSQPSGLPNRLFSNDGGMMFTDVTDAAGVGVLDSTSMSLIEDADNDGDQDLIVITAVSPLLFRNDGAGGFRHAPHAFELGSARQGQLTSATLADYDLDGDLDLYLCAYRYHAGTGVRHAPTPYHDANNGPPNYLLRNRGDGTFEDATQASGLNVNNSRFSFAAAWQDFDGDSRPDLYVANDFGRNNLYRNNGDGTFSEVAPQMGVEDVGAGMSASWFDYDRDGILDLYVGNMWSAAGLRLSNQSRFRSMSEASERSLYQRHAKGNTLFRGQPNGTFVDATFEAGVAQGRWAWSSGNLDFDNDGFEDIYIANGYVTNSQTHDL